MARLAGPWTVTLTFATPWALVPIDGQAPPVNTQDAFQFAVLPIVSAPLALTTSGSAASSPHQPLG